MLKSVIRFWPVVVAGLGAYLASCQPNPERTPVAQEEEAQDSIVVFGGNTDSTGFAPQFVPDPVVVHPGGGIRFRNNLTGQGGDSVWVHLERVPVTPILLSITRGDSARVTVLTEAPYGTYKYRITVFRGQLPEVFDPFIDVQPPPNP